MDSLHTNAHLRAPSRFARLLAWLGAKTTADDRLPEQLSDHLARDIGMSKSQIERMRLQWPSQTQRPNI